VPSDNLDINEIVKRGSISVAPEEHPDERTARLRNEGREKLIADVKGVILFGVLLIAVIGTGLLCVYLIVFETAATQETKRWAETVIAALISGSVSFLIGRAISNK